MDTLLHDLRYALRTLRRSPGFAAVAVLTLALGIGATTAIFSVVDGVLLTPLPYEEPDELVMVWERNTALESLENVVSPANYFDWREQMTAFEDLAALAQYGAALTGAGEPERVGLVRASASFFPVIGVEAAVGRVYTEAEDVEGGPPVAILSHGFWQRRFGGDPATIGRTLTLNGRSVVVVGVLPDGFGFDLPQNLNAVGTQDVWVPMQYGAEDRERRGRYLQVVGRLEPGVSIAEAQAQMSTLARRLEQVYPEFQTGWDVNVVPLHQQVVGDVQNALLLILGAVGFVLLIACANVANLLMARAVARRQEISLRAVLGAGRRRLVRQFLTESLALALVGGLLGLFLAWAGVRGLVAAAPDIPRLDEIGVDATILAFAFGLSLFTGLLFGLLPAAQGSRSELGATLREGGARAGSGRRLRRTRSGLVVAEIGLSLMLLVGGGLLIRSFANLVDVDVGFDTDGLLTASLQLPSSSYTSAERVQFFDELVTRVQALPGVDAASAITFPPLAPGASRTRFWANDRPIPEPGEGPSADVRWVQADYHATMGIPLIAGRLFDGRDNPDAPLRVVASRAVTEQLWPGESAIGKVLSLPWGDTLVAEIIGVVGDVHHEGPSVEPYPTLYWDHRQFQAFSYMTLVVRTAGEPLGLVPALRAQVRAIDPELPLYDVRTMRSYLSDALARARFATLALGLFALVALVLASVGIYGVLSYNVGQRTREFGVRISLGATGRDVVALVLGQALRLVCIAVAAGAAGALVLSRVMQGLVFEVGTNDPLTFVAAGLFLAGVALFACWIPARRAAKVEPMAVLRQE